jgi:hypothetical protein
MSVRADVGDVAVAVPAGVQGARVGWWLVAVVVAVAVIAGALIAWLL